MITCMLTYLPLDKKVFSTNSSTPIIQTSNCFLIWSKNKKTKLTVPFGRHPKALASRFGANAQGFRVLMWSCGFFIRKTQLYTLCAIHLMLPIISYSSSTSKRKQRQTEMNLTVFPTKTNSPPYQCQIGLHCQGSHQQISSWVFPQCPITISCLTWNHEMSW